MLPALVRFQHFLPLISAVHTNCNLFVTQLHTSRISNECCYCGGRSRNIFYKWILKASQRHRGERWVICNETNKSALQHSNIKNNLATEVLSIDLLLSCKGAIATCSQKRGKTRKTTRLLYACRRWITPQAEEQSFTFCPRPRLL